MHHVRRHFKKLFVCELESRVNPAMTVSLAGAAVTFTGDGGADSLQLYTDGFGKLSHSIPAGGNLVNAQDLDGTLPGEQSVLTANVTNLSINLGAGGNNTASLDTISRPLTVTNVDNLTGVTAAAGSTSATLTNTGITFTNPSYAWTLGTVGNVRLDGGTGNNSFDASAVTAYAVQLRGNDGNDTLKGGSQADFLIGGPGNDLLEGNDGDDSNQIYNNYFGYVGLYGEDGNDTIRGGAGNDFIQDIGPDGSADGGTGTDSYYGYNAASALITNTTFQMGTAASIGNNLEAIRIDGDNNDNVLDASAVTTAAVHLRGNDGNDTLRGGSQPDLLVGGPGNDILEGNDGDDSNQFYSTLLGGYCGLYGENGNDTLRGGPGNDFLQDIGPDGAADGGTGTDYYYAYEAASALLTDTAFSMGAAVSIGNGFEAVRIDGDANNNVLDASAVTAYPVFFRGYDGNDTLKGGSQPDFLVGGTGNDTLEGNGGDDSNAVFNANWGYGGLYGEEGNDTLRGGPGNDFLQDIGPDGAADGGTGTDYYFAYNAASALITDTTFIMGVAASVGNGMESIRIDGDDNNNVFNASAVTAIPVFFRGYGGNDTLRGGAMPDFLVGGQGNDIIDGNGGDDSNAVFNANWGYGGLFGEEGNDTLSGGSGNDSIQDIGPDGAADGGPGTDSFYAYNVASATITDTAFTMGAGVSIGNGFEGVRLDGTTGADTFDGSACTLTAFYFLGGDGNDILKGGAQPDSLNGQIGNDTLEGNGGDDTGYNAAINASAGLSGNSGNDILRGGEGADTLNGNDGDDTLDGGNGNDTLDGSTENDVLTGGPGNDLMYGGPGDDTFYDGPETNTILGEGNFDILYLTATAAADIIVVDTPSVTINGQVTAYTTMETLNLDAGDDVDTGTLVPPTLGIPFTATRLEPTVLAGPNETSLSNPFVRTGGSFRDIGDPGSTWTGSVDYGDGGGFQPLIVNSVAKSFALNHTYNLGGSFLVRVRITDSQGNTGESSFTVDRPAGIQVGITGGAQRSMIERLRITFDADYSLNGAWYTFQRLDGPTPTVSVSSGVVLGKRVATLTFSGSIDPGASLKDGNYRLTLFGANILKVSDGSAFDGNGDGNPGGDFVFNFHRLKGDLNGDRSVLTDDLTAFGNAFNTTAPNLDYVYAGDLDGNGVVNIADLTAFGNNFNITLP